MLDEPLAIMAAAHFFNMETLWSDFHFLRDGLSTSDSSARGVAFTQFSPYLLGLAFRTPRPLSSVFTFIGRTSQEKETGQLVAIYKDNNGFCYDPVDILSGSGPTYILGYTAHMESDTISWLQDPKQTIFCFLAKTVRPDLILYLKLSDGTILLLLVQLKQTMSLGATGTE